MQQLETTTKRKTTNPAPSYVAEEDDMDESFSDHSDSQSGLLDEGDDLESSSALEARRRRKKGLTVAQSHGKQIGRWTDEEHARFLEGKRICEIRSINKSY